MAEGSWRNCGQCLTTMVVAFAKYVFICIVRSGIWIGVFGLEPQIG